MLVARPTEPDTRASSRHTEWTGLRLALVGPLPPPSAGMANQTEQLGRLLRAEGVPLQIVRTNATYRPRWVEHIHWVRAGVRLGSYGVTLRRVLRDVDLVHVMANSGWSWHLHAAPAIWAARLAGVPVVVNYRGGAAEAFFARSFRAVLPTLSRADAVVVPSGFLEAVFRRRGIPVHVVPNVIDLDRFRPGPRPAPGRAPHFLIARNLEQIYDIPTGLRAFAVIRETFPGARLTVAGTGPLRPDLEHLAAQLRVTDAVHFTGRLDNERMASLYQSVDLVLNPTRIDNMPISVLEALASGVPVVSTDVGGIPFVVEHGRTGLLVPPGDPEAMAGAASSILRTPGLATAFRDAGIAATAQYAWPIVGPQLLAVYTKVLRRGTPASAPGETV